MICMDWKSIKLKELKKGDLVELVLTENALMCADNYQFDNVVYLYNRKANSKGEKACGYITGVGKKGLSLESNWTQESADFETGTEYRFSIIKSLKKLK